MNFQGSKFTFEYSFGELTVRINETSIFISSSDAIRACITTRKEIIAGFNTSEDYNVVISRIVLNEAKSLRECSFSTKNIELIIEDRVYNLSINLNKIEISAEDFDFIIIKPIASNVASFKGIDK